IRTRPEPLPVTLTSGVLPRRDQVRPLPGFRSWFCQDFRDAVTERHADQLTCSASAPLRW
ncbi:hypothetical protein, partial [Streptomyces sp. NPDC090445]|uniref:hypothetical protein n=1 Tax=Streptomyces sp. NPDC090445 TaxID=3365963 RepID=UPI00382C3052